MTDKIVFRRIPDIILAQLACFCLVYGLTSSLCLPYPPQKIMLISLFFILTLFAAFLNKKTMAATYVILGFCLLAALIYVIFKIGFSTIALFFDEYFYWLETYMQYPDIYDPLYEKITVVALCILLSIFTYIFIVHKFIFYVIAGAGIGLFAVQSSYGLISSFVPFFIFLPLTLMLYIKHISSRKTLKPAGNSSELSSSGNLAFLSLPVCILIIGSASLFHINEKPIEWKWMDKKITSVYNYFKNRFDYEVFDYFSLSATSGFGDRNGILGGRVKLDKTNVLKVDTVKNVYLKGATRDVYTGTRWGNSSVKKNHDLGILHNDTEEMLTGMKLLTGRNDFLNDYFYSNKITITYMNLKTKSLFIPSKSYSFAPAQGNFEGLANYMGDLSSVRSQTKGFKYFIDLYTPKIGSVEFTDMLRKSKKGFYQECLFNLSTFVPTTSSSFVFTENIQLDKEISQLVLNSKHVYNEYLQLPENLPQRVRELSASIVEPYNNNYDKAKAIEQYLSLNYPYNLDVRSTPRGRDFVDYFLFDLREGYCSYFATAMAVLARCAGLPSRYAEGYILPPETMSHSSSSSYLVTNMQAHAWVEIYFEGYGWLPFEPTSPFRANFYSTDDSSTFLSGNYNSVYNDYMEMMNQYGNQNSGYDDIEVTGTNYATKDKNLLLPVILITVIMFIVLIIFNAIRSRFRLYKILNLPAKVCIVKLYEYYISVLKIQRLGYKPAETPNQYGLRIDSIMYFNPVKFKTISSVFVRARYSNIGANENEKQLFIDFCPVFFKTVKSNMGKYYYFLQKYILGRF